MKNDLFICDCNSIEHQIIFSYFEDADLTDVYMTVHLIPEDKIWKRVWYAIKYIFGYRCMYGHFDEFIFKKEDANKLQSIVNYLKK